MERKAREMIEEGDSRVCIFACVVYDCFLVPWGKKAEKLTRKGEIKERKRVRGRFIP